MSILQAVLTILVALLSLKFAFIMLWVCIEMPRRPSRKRAADGGLHRD